MVSMLRLTALGASFVLAGVLAGPAANAQAVDCDNLPDLHIAEPAEFAQCAPPVVVAERGQSGGLPALGFQLRAGGGPGRGYIAFDYEDGLSATLIAAEAESYFAGDFAGNDFTQIYAVDFPAGEPQLWSINSTTGVRTLIGGTGLAAATNVSGMAWDYTTGTMFATVLGTGVTSIYSVDLATGAMTLVVPVTGGVTAAINFLIHPNTGVMYAVDNGLDDLFSIDRVTGVSTLIGDIGYAISFAQGADFDGGSSVAYMCAYVSGGVNTIRTLDLTTGLSTEVSGFTNSEVDFCASMTPFIDVANEPPAPNEARLVAEPNPFSQQTQLLLTVGQEQQVRVEIYDMVGRHVTTLYDAHVAAGQPVVVTLHGTDLRPGVYVARAIGETFVQTQQLTVAR